MTYAEEKALKLEKLQKLASMSESEKLVYAIQLLEDSLESPYDDCTDYEGIYYTDEYYEHERKKEEFLEAIKL